MDTGTAECRRQCGRRENRTNRSGRGRAPGSLDVGRVASDFVVRSDGGWSIRYDRSRVPCAFPRRSAAGKHRVTGSRETRSRLLFQVRPRAQEIHFESQIFFISRNRRAWLVSSRHRRCAGAGADACSGTGIREHTRWPDRQQQFRWNSPRPCRERRGPGC